MNNKPIKPGVPVIVNMIPLGCRRSMRTSVATGMPEMENGFRVVRVMGFADPVPTRFVTVVA